MFWFWSSLCCLGVLSVAPLRAVLCVLLMLSVLSCCLLFSVLSLCYRCCIGTPCVPLVFLCCRGVLGVVLVFPVMTWCCFHGFIYIPVLYWCSQCCLSVSVALVFPVMTCCSQCFLGVFSVPFVLMFPVMTFVSCVVLVFSVYKYLDNVIQSLRICLFHLPHFIHLTRYFKLVYRNFIILLIFLNEVYYTVDDRPENIQ